MSRFGPADVGSVVADWGPGEWFGGFVLVFLVMLALWAFGGGRRR